MKKLLDDISSLTRKALLLVVILICGLLSATGADTTRQVIPAKPPGSLVDDATMQQIYDQVKTPFKYGVVLKGGSTNELVDCPSIFRSGYAG